MKVKRQKRAKKLIGQYRREFTLPQPIPVIIDSTFVKQALLQKINIAEQLPKYLGENVKLCTASCVLKECKTLGTLLYGPLKVLQNFMEIKCTHSYNPEKGAPVCLHNRIQSTGQNSRFAIASNDDELRESARTKGGVPVFYISHHSINLEPMSDKSCRLMAESTAAKISLSKRQLESLDALDDSPELSKEPPKKKRRAREPNPLSCKKKKKKPILPPPAVTKKIIDDNVDSTEPVKKNKKFRVSWAMRQLIDQMSSQNQANS